MNTNIPHQNTETPLWNDAGDRATSACLQKTNCEIISFVQPFKLNIFYADIFGI
jgi:hypothetical protein